MGKLKNIEEMSDHEILMELIKEKRRNDILRYINYGLVAIVSVFVAVECSIYIPKIMAFMDKYNQVLDTLNETSASIKRISDSISTDTIDAFNNLVSGISDLLKRFGINY